MKNLKGAAPSIPEETSSSRSYFANLGIGLVIIGLIISIGTIILFFTAVPNSGYTNEEGRVVFSIPVFAFMMIMSITFLGTGLALITVAKRMGKKGGTTD